jgi:hypothetical protein
MLARDSRSLREYIKEIQPDINLKVDLEIEGEIDTVDLPIGVNFFFPDL